MTAFSGERDAKMCADLFELGNIQSTIMAVGGHSLDATTPMFDQPQFLKYSTKDAVAEFGDALSDVLNREAERKQTRVLNLQPIVK